MSTRSKIAKKTEKGTYLSIYCHFDGYPEGVGETLQKYYQEEERIDALLELGDLSILNRELDGVVDSCKAYHRDFGEDYEDTKAYEYETLGKLCKASQHTDYLYIFDNEVWSGYKWGDLERKVM